MEKSLCELIVSSLTPEVTLPAGFRLPDDKAEDGKVKFADGALDGIFVYHIANHDFAEEDKKKLAELVNLAASGAIKEAEEGFKSYCETHRAITLIDELQNYIMDHSSELDPTAMYKFAVELIISSSDKECVKIGLSIMELFDAYENEALARNIRLLGLSDEFTLFSVFCMRNWPAAEKELLELAKRVRGWGRIHCIDFIEAEDQETKDWLFFHGVDNDVLPAYSAWKVYEKADVNERLKKEQFTDEELHALLMLTDALMDEGPVRGLSRMEDPNAYLAAVLKKTEGDHVFNEDEKRVLKSISEWGKET